MDANALLIREWQHALESEHKSRKTITSYTESVRALSSFLDGADLLGATTDDLRRFIARLLATRTASTAATRYRCLQQFYGWAVRDRLLEVSPMATMRPPTIPETPVPVVPPDDLHSLLKACEGRGFHELRDAAIIRLMLEPGGMRRAEVVGLSVADADLENDTIGVVGKGRRPRAIPYGHKTGQALTRYLRARMQHPLAKRSDALWLAQKGPLTDSGLAQMLERRCAQAGIPRIKAHQLRHTAADRWLSESGGDETSAMRLFGWRSRQMLQRYAASNADARAHAAARRLGIGDKL